ncbi:MAG TPA: 3-deoxy-D-manno-octulosonic acid transferase [Beijerinckiaceae bacterium]|nr:3-deoxy-D-manno-octulosonic acid transferase [Beijerinckiaceae bacterium]
MSGRDPLSLHLHRLATTVIEPAMPAFLRSRQKRGKEHAERMPERLGLTTLKRPDGPLVWMHGASVGETVSLLPLIDALVAKRFNVLLTSGTVTSAEVAARRLPAGALHQFAPVDTPTAAERFITHWQPDLALFAESELWPNLIRIASASGTVLGIVNGRMSPRSFRTWRKAPRFIGALLHRFALVLAQSEADAERYRLLGATRACSVGNIKFDVAAPPADPATLRSLRGQIGERPVFIAASTHPGEEEAVIAAHISASDHLPALLTIVAPRHPERGPHLETSASRAGLSTARRSRGEAITPKTDLYVADTIGELGLIYRLGRVAYLGGSLIEHGGQNPIEPAKLGLAILHGPHVFNFTDVYAAFGESGATDLVTEPEQLGPAVARRLDSMGTLDRMGAQAMLTATALGGAVGRTLNALEPHLTHLRSRTT